MLSFLIEQVGLALHIKVNLIIISWASFLCQKYYVNNK